MRHSNEGDMTHSLSSSTSPSPSSSSLSSPHLASPVIKPVPNHSTHTSSCLLSSLSFLSTISFLTSSPFLFSYISLQSPPFRVLLVHLILLFFLTTSDCPSFVLQSLQSLHTLPLCNSAHHSRQRLMTLLLW